MTRRSLDHTYKKGNTCPVCGKRITDRARQCRKHMGKFMKFLQNRYGYRPKIGKRSKSLRRFDAFGNLIGEDE